ncbi:hypothetical protein SAMN05421678_103155 [Actinopolymorpha cephalotaxi]|uniref:Uncharacterized protein n=1 Tax=Actinopolymorpha cephalotaxi TaxID=504797 RepID=A0A1I2N7H0_9ACTN|nr:hypothetical protein SAMN05421678_103155 [Actinopolymorpha cephalotaxi]
MPPTFPAAVHRSTSSRCPYRSIVIDAVVCPSTRWTTFGSAPWASQIEAAVCRRSWTRSVGAPTDAAARRQPTERFQSRSTRPAHCAPAAHPSRPLDRPADEPRPSRRPRRRRPGADHDSEVRRTEVGRAGAALTASRGMDPPRSTPSASRPPSSTHKDGSWPSGAATTVTGNHPAASSSSASPSTTASAGRSKRRPGSTSSPTHSLASTRT